MNIRNLEYVVGRKKEEKNKKNEEEMGKREIKIIL